MESRNSIEKEKTKGRDAVLLSLPRSCIQMPGFSLTGERDKAKADRVVLYRDIMDSGTNRTALGPGDRVVEKTVILFYRCCNPPGGSSEVW